MGRTRENTAVVPKRRERFALSNVQSEESLVAVREHLLTLRTKKGKPYEQALWESLAWKAVKGHRDALKHIGRIMYGWVDKDSDLEQRIMAALGVTLDVARAAVQLMVSTQEKDPHASALSAVRMLQWYTRTMRPIDPEVLDGIRQCQENAARGGDAQRAQVVDEGEPDLALS